MEEVCLFPGNLLQLYIFYNHTKKQNMKAISFLRLSMVMSVVLVVSACNKNAEKSAPQTNAQSPSSMEAMMSENGANPDESAITEFSSASNTDLTSGLSFKKSGHYLYTESNNVDKNSILMYSIMSNGDLHYDGSVESGGAGTGAPLGSQGALAIDKNHNWLYAVNAGGNSVSSFRINHDGSLTLFATVSSGGVGPNSLSVYGNLLYVLNHGSDNIHGFRTGGGNMIDISGSSEALSGTGVDAPQISFTPNGEWLIVTEKATNTISTFKVKPNGKTSTGVFTPSTGQTPFGFDFSRDYVIVSNAVGGGALAGSATSYIIRPNGAAKDVNGAIPNAETAPCWFATTKYGRFAYTTNTGTNNISSYYVSPWGGLYLVHSEAAKTDMGPLDIVVAANNYFVYELNAKSNTIGAYYRKFLGGLQYISSVSNLPAPTTGFATF